METKLDFDIKKEIVRCKSDVKIEALKVAISIGVISVVGLMAVGWYDNRSESPFNNNIVLIILIICAILYSIFVFFHVSHRSKVEGKAGYVFIVDYAQNMINKNPDLNRFKELSANDLALQLVRLNGCTYSQLDKPLKEIAIYSVANRLYFPTMLFADEIFKEVYDANSDDDIHKIFDSSDKVINVEENLMKRRIKRTKSRGL